MFVVRRDIGVALKQARLLVPPHTLKIADIVINVFAPSFDDIKPSRFFLDGFFVVEKLTTLTKRSKYGG